MSKPLQLTGYQASDYERPNDGWTCGKQACGDPCPFGPSSGGACGWTCTPLEVAGGLECGRPGRSDCAGPTRDAKGRPQCCEVPCQPAPTIRRLRGIVNKAAVLLTVAALALVMAHRETRDAVVSPGELSAHHAALSCGDCHAAAVSSETRSITSAALLREHVNEKVDAAKCARCHELEAPAWRFAHTLDATPEQARGAGRPASSSLAALQSNALARWVDGAPRPGLLAEGAKLLSSQYGQRSAEGTYHVTNELDCLLCHGEHRGREASLQKDVPEHRCTVCHTVGFDSFEQGHPEFRRFGVRELSGNLVFTHGTHYERYGLAPKGKDGHLDYSRGAACATCHESDSRGRHMVLKARTYETECLRCHQATAGPVDLVQTPSGPELAWFDDFRFRTYLPALRDPREGAQLFAPLGLSDDPAKLREDLGALRSLHNKLLELAPLDEDGDERFSSSDIVGPAKLKPLKDWLTEKEEAAEGDDDEEGGDEEGDDEEGGDVEGERIAEAKELVEALESRRKSLSRTLRKRKKKAVKAQRERASAYTKRVKALIASLSEGDMTPIREGFGLGPLADLSSLEAVFPKAQLKTFQEAWWSPSGSSQTRDLRLEPVADALGAWQGGGRVVASDALGGLRYEGYTHLDPFLMALVELAPEASPKGRAALVGVFAERCGKCHTATTEDGGLQVQWKAVADPAETQRRLTHFAHEAHLGIASCTDCHQLQLGRKPSERIASDFVTADRWRQVGQAGVAQSGCRECHTSQSYGADCQLCHDYHAGALTPGAGSLPHWGADRK